MQVGTILLWSSQYWEGGDKVSIGRMGFKGTINSDSRTHTVPLFPFIMPFIEDTGEAEEAEVEIAVQIAVGKKVEKKVEKEVGIEVGSIVGIKVEIGTSNCGISIESS